MTKARLERGRYIFTLADCAFGVASKTGGKVAVAQYVSLKHPTAGDGTTPAGSWDERIDLTGTGAGPREGERRPQSTGSQPSVTRTSRVNEPLALNFQS